MFHLEEDLYRQVFLHKVLNSDYLVFFETYLSVQVVVRVHQILILVGRCLSVLLKILKVTHVSVDTCHFLTQGFNL